MIGSQSKAADTRLPVSPNMNKNLLTSMVFPAAAIGGCTMMAWNFPPQVVMPIVVSHSFHRHVNKQRNVDQQASPESGRVAGRQRGNIPCL